LAIVELQDLVLPVLDTIAAPVGSLDPSAFAARNRFARRALKLLNNALRWRAYARGVLLPPASEAGASGEGGTGSMTLEQTLVNELVAKVLLPVLEAGWETGCREISVKVRPNFRHFSIYHFFLLKF
jgi:GC-rich sequence DNA-binding factor